MGVAMVKNFNQMLLNIWEAVVISARDARLKIGHQLMSQP
jgi:hypothetical protein